MAGNGCFSPSKTLNMYAPSGFVSASTARKKTPIWIHPIAVMSEPLRPDQRVDEVDSEEDRSAERDRQLERHGAPPRPAQKRTWAQQAAKKAAVARTRRRSSIHGSDRGGGFAAH